MEYKKVLTIAGSDSGGGAGIQADIKTISACGCYAMTAITAITVQNTIGVSQVYPISTQAIEEQMEAVITDIGLDAVKIGMLHSSEIIIAVKNILQKYKITNVVLDPVMVSTSGHKLIKDEDVETLKTELVKHVRIITPNIPEAEVMLGKKIMNQTEIPQYARELSMNGSVSVLIKGGHMSDDKLIDTLYDAETDKIVELISKRLYTKNTHGTGCTLSSAIASMLAQGKNISDSVSSAKEYIDNAIIHGAKYEIGHGHGPVHHFWKYWK